MQKRVIIYGAGKKGQHYLKYLNTINDAKFELLFCDKNASEIKEVNNVKVYSFDYFMNGQDDIFIVSTTNTGYRKEIIDLLISYNKQFCENLEEWIKLYFKDPVEADRQIIALYHIDNRYYSDVEDEDSMNIFWGENTDFYRMFKKLDCSNIVELACGEGRHVRKYINQSKSITLVDILEENIAKCKERYSTEDKIYYYKNNGYDLTKLPDSKYTALFTYDAMVHFEMLDIYSYLKETYRILKPDSYALFHHSNNNRSYKENFLSNVGYRNYMSKEIFAYFAYKCGFEIVEQKVIDWGTLKDIDCISLLKK